ncbi:hypothetical protein EDC94DRAFT_584578 [Helicostylum pulchrum]|nr:hypothetical protein EDC94DRAFT_584578 [Helicostylum pulchrum]
MSDNQKYYLIELIYMESSSYTSVTQQTDSNIKQEYVQESSYSQYTSKNNDANDVKLSSTSNKYSDVGPTPRSYLDSTVVPTLLEGLKLLATERATLSNFFFTETSDTKCEIVMMQIYILNSHNCTVFAIKVKSWYDDNQDSDPVLNPDKLTSSQILMQWLTVPENFIKYRNSKVKSYIGVKSTPEKIEPIFQAHNLASDWSYESGEEILNNSSFDGVPTTDARRRINDQLKKMCFEYFKLHPLFKRAIGFASCPINLSDFNNVAAIMMGRN